MFTMHDLVHDLAESVIVDEIQVAPKQGYTGGRIRYELLDDCTELLKGFTQYPTKIRALRCLESDKTVHHGASSSSAKFLSFLVFGKIGLRDDIFSASKYLRVLDLSECFIPELPNSIGNLKQLRYLNAPRVQHWIIPNCITKLSKLIYLNLCGSSAISELPKSIGEMEGLMYLDLSGCSALKKLPMSFAKLTKLVHLDLSNCSQVVGVSKSLERLRNLEYLNLSYCSKIGNLPEHLGSLLQLRNLNLSYSSYLRGRGRTECFVALTKLERLNMASEPYFLNNLPETFSRHTNLKYLNLSGSMRAVPPFGNPKNLVYLDLSHCHDSVSSISETLACLTKLQHLNLSKLTCSCSDGKLHLARMSKAVGNLTELRYLNLSSFLPCARGDDESFSSVLECISNLRNLEHLDLSADSRIKSVPDCFRSLRKLRTLDLSWCWRLRSLPAFVTEMNSLTFLHLEACNDLQLQIWGQPAALRKILFTLPDFVVQADCRDSGSNLVLLQDVNRTNLEISKLEKVKSVQETRNIELSKKQRMKELEVNWTEDAERFVEDADVLGELVPPSTLNGLRICGYQSVRLPEWFAGISSHFPNLVRITMSNLPKCNRLPPFGQLPNLQNLVLRRMNGISKIDGDLRGSGKRSFPQLRYFFLEKMESLQVWYTTYSYGEVGMIEFMFPNLRVLETYYCPNLRLEPCMHRAERLHIRGDGVISWRESASASHTSPSPPAPVTALRVKGCKVPMHQWRLLHHLPFLVELTIEECSDLRSSPEIMRALSSLRSLTLIHKDHREQLPNWLGNLTSLKKLTIKGYKPKVLQNFNEHLTLLESLSLVNIKRMKVLPQWVGNLISIQRLVISGCRYLNVLPESIGRLNSLKELEIHSCRSITSLPQGIQQLTRLEILKIVNCHELEKWCKAEENKGKLAHIKQKKFTP